jgi:hypothetical protein
MEGLLDAGGQTTAPKTASDMSPNSLERCFGTAKPTSGLVGHACLAVQHLCDDQQVRPTQQLRRGPWVRVRYAFVPTWSCCSLRRFDSERDVFAGQGVEN